jgi:uncharacterized membrane protein
MNKLQKLKAFWALFHTGKRLANAGIWKQRQVTVNMMEAFLAATAGVAAILTGTEVQVGDETLNTASTAVLGFVYSGMRVWDAVMVVITTNKIGVDGVRPPPPEEAK